MIENKIWLNNPNQYVIGADEVGRGSFAGPIVAAAVKIKKSHDVGRDIFSRFSPY